MKKLAVLLVEDDEVLGRSMVQRLGLEGFSVNWTRTAARASEALKTTKPDVIVCDIRLPDGDGATVMRSHFKQLGLVPTIFMTAYGDIDHAVRLVREGAWDYLAKPFDLDALMERLIQFARSASADQPTPLTSSAPEMARVSETLRKAANLQLPVTLLGETGTGKEVAARMLHRSGPRASFPFVAVNSGLLQSEMTDSLLFGHERGAFTGANDAHIGFVEEAGEGTLFLDEIGELDPQMQVKLLRLLDQNTFRRLGGSKDLEFKARLVCATNRDLGAMVDQGAFRRDLWFRINVITVTLPPLRARVRDIKALLEDRLAKAATQFARPSPKLSPPALEKALAYSWPGNVRELVNRVDRAVAMSDSVEISVVDLFPDLKDDDHPHANRDAAATTLAEARDAAERSHILKALEENEGKIQPTADQLGVSRTTLWERMKRFGIDPDL